MTRPAAARNGVAPVDGRRQRWYRAEADFMSTPFARALGARFGAAGITLWHAYLGACKLADPEGQITYATEQEALGILRCRWLKLVDSAGDSFTLDDLWTLSGRYKETLKRRSGDLTQTCKTRWTDTQQALRTDRGTRRTQGGGHKRKASSDPVDVSQEHPKSVPGPSQEHPNNVPSRAKDFDKDRDRKPETNRLPVSVRQPGPGSVPDPAPEGPDRNATGPGDSDSGDRDRAPGVAGPRRFAALAVAQATGWPLEVVLAAADTGSLPAEHAGRFASELARAERAAAVTNGHPPSRPPGAAAAAADLEPAAAGGGEDELPDVPFEVFKACNRVPRKHGLGIDQLLDGWQRGTLPVAVAEQVAEQLAAIRAAAGNGQPQPPEAGP